MYSGKQMKILQNKLGFQPSTTESQNFSTNHFYIILVSDLCNLLFLGCNLFLKRVT